MNNAAVVLFWALVVLALAQAVLVPRFVRRLTRCRPAPAPDAQCPKTSVVLCLRGPDPFLTSCLEGLLTQDYPCYDVRILVDCQEDPAWRTVEEVVARFPAVQVEVQALTERRTTCGLKCSSLLQAIAALDPSCAVLALLDADTIPHRTWLRELVAPFSDPKVGAASGNRWYMPSTLSWGSLIRYLWNAAAVVQMFWYRIPWGGSLAVRMTALRECGLTERWSKSFCEDTMLFRQLSRKGYEVAFVPSLMMINREACSLGGFFGWVRRQLLTARLYHPAWALVAGHGLGIFAAHLASVVLLAVGLVRGNLGMVGCILGGQLLYWGIMAALIVAMERAVRSIPAARGEPTRWLSLRGVVWLAGALPATQAVYAAALFSAMRVRTVAWRGVHYRVDGPFRICLLDDRPFCAEPSAGPKDGSL